MAYIQSSIGQHLTISPTNLYTTKLLNDFSILVENDLFDQALNTYHLLFMAVIYKSIVQYRDWYMDKFELATILLSFRDISPEDMKSTSDIFKFSSIQERSIMDFLKLIGADKNTIKQCKKLVDERNQRSHATGYFLDNPDVFEIKIMTYDNTAEYIHTLLTETLLEITDTFFSENDDLSEFSTDDLTLYFIEPYKLSISDLNTILHKSRNNKISILRKQINTFLASEWYRWLSYYISAIKFLL